MNKYYVVIWGEGYNALITQKCEPSLIEAIAPIAINRALSNLGLDGRTCNYMITRNWFKAKLSNWSNS